MHGIGMKSRPVGQLLQGYLAVPSGTQDLAGLTVLPWVVVGVMERD